MGKALCGSKRMAGLVLPNFSLSRFSLPRSAVCTSPDLEMHLVIGIAFPEIASTGATWCVVDRRSSVRYVKMRVIIALNPSITQEIRGRALSDGFVLGIED